MFGKWTNNIEGTAKYVNNILFKKYAKHSDAHF